MDNQEDAKVLNEDEEKRKRREKVKRYAGYAGIGFVVGYPIHAILLGLPFWVVMFFGFEDPLEYIFPISMSFFSILGGIIGGALSKKWWGAVLGSGIVSPIGFYISLFLYIMFNIRA